MPNLIEQLEYAACGQGPDAEQTLYWRARCEIKRLEAGLSHIADGKMADWRGYARAVVSKQEAQ